MPRLTAWVPTASLAAPLVDLVVRAETKVTEQLVAELRRDSLQSTLDSMRQVSATLLRWLGNDAISSTVTTASTTSRRLSDGHWAGQVGGALGQTVALDTSLTRARAAAWIAENTARIQGLRNETIVRVQADLETAVLSGTRPEELAAKWEREGLPTTNGTLRGRANVIARDQLGKLAGQMAEHQQRALGLTEYMWDDRPAVTRSQRPVHRGRRGARYDWDAAPPGGHPGTEVMCSCRAVASVPLSQLAERFS